jgi:hypothetical protein
MSATSIDDRYAEFLITVGGMCDAAQRAGLGVVVETEAGTQVTGVPMMRAAGARDELNDTGYARTFRVDDAQVNLDEVVSCTIRAPGGHDLRLDGRRSARPTRRG